MANLRAGQSTSPNQQPQGGPQGAAPGQGGEQGPLLANSLSDAFQLFTTMVSGGQAETAIEIVTQFFEALQSIGPQQAQEPAGQVPGAAAPLPGSVAQGAPLPGGPQA